MALDFDCRPGAIVMATYRPKDKPDDEKLAEYVGKSGLFVAEMRIEGGQNHGLWMFHSADGWEFERGWLIETDLKGVKLYEPSAKP